MIMAIVDKAYMEHLSLLVVRMGGQVGSKEQRNL